MENQITIELSTTVKSTPDFIWRALTDPDELEDWWGDGVKIEPRVGGKFEEPWEDEKRNRRLATGQVKVVKKNKEISFTWKEETWPKKAQTLCNITIEDNGKFCAVRVIHSGWETLPDEDRKQQMKDFKVGWGYHLKELQAYLEQ